MLYFLRMFEKVSYIVAATFKIVWGLFSFFLVYIIMIFSFSQAVYVASQYHEFNYHQEARKNDQLEQYKSDLESQVYELSYHYLNAWL